jgi:heme A synthase
VAGSTLAQARGPAIALGVLVVCQLLVGVLNVVLLTPVTVQVLHLLLADCVWITLVILAAEIGYRGTGGAGGAGGAQTK